MGPMTDWLLNKIGGSVVTDERDTTALLEQVRDEAYAIRLTPVLEIQAKVRREVPASETDMLIAALLNEVEGLRESSHTFVPCDCFETTSGDTHAPFCSSTRTTRQFAEYAKEMEAKADQAMAHLANISHARQLVSLPVSAQQDDLDLAIKAARKMLSDDLPF